ncbi:MAG TPA: ROK family protein [Gemmatales bacterium]|nr:ROK family protein [Gemmatales bacterium]HMP60954.1 ROK family protein [Gemmatales bacterium]
MSHKPLFVGVDVGGQSIKAGVVTDVGHPLSCIDLPTEADQGQEHGLEQMARAVEKAVATAQLTLADLAGIGVATPGTMDIHFGVILDPPNLKPWKNVPVRQFIQERFHLPTAFQNDANAAAFGEYWAGAGRGSRSLVLFTLGTGIGCGIIVNDLIIEGVHSHGAEVGHIVIQMENGRMCGCGQPGHLEAYASARAVVKRAKEALRANNDTSLLRQQLPADALATDEEEETREARWCSLVFSAAVAGDILAERLVDQTAYALAIGAVNMMHTIDPDTVLFGGGMISTGDWFLERIQHYIRKHAFPVPAAKARIAYAELGGSAGYIGAAGCAHRAWLRSQRAFE